MARAVAGEESALSLSELRKTKHCCNPLQEWYVRRWCLHEHYIHTYMHTYIHTSQSCALINEKQFNKSIRL